MKPISLTQLDEDGRQLAARAAELCRRAAYDVAASDFLTPREQRIFQAAAVQAGGSDRLVFWGGAVGAERRMALLLPDWLRDEMPPGDPFSEARGAFLRTLNENGVVELSSLLVPLTLRVSAYKALTHRDWLGSLMALGIERHVLGDIAVLDEHCAIGFFAARIAPFVKESFTRAGADAVTVEDAAPAADFEIPRTYLRVEGTVASPRLDGVVHALTGLSRAEAALLVTRGEAELNYFPETKPDAAVEDGDVLSVRGWGKYRIDSVNAVTRRGRNRVVARKYT